ncbi:hypothetical protein JNB11_03130 [Kocuria palustris]|nr:hypothetical protein [Kocuria palustris]
MSVPRRYQRTGIGGVHADSTPPTTTRGHGRLVLAGTVNLLRSLLLLTDILLTYLINRASLGFMRSSYVLKRQMEEQGLIEGDENLRNLRGVLLTTPVLEETDDELKEALDPAYRIDTTSLVSSHQLYRSATTLFDSLGPVPVPEPTSRYGRRNLRKIDEEKRMSVASALSSNATLNQAPLRLSNSTPLNGSTLLRRYSDPVPRRHSVSPQPYNKSIQPPLSARSSIVSLDILISDNNRAHSARSPTSQPTHQSQSESRRASLGGVRRLGQRLPMMSPSSPNSVASPVNDDLVTSLKKYGSLSSLNHRHPEDRSNRRSVASSRVRNSHPNEIDLIQARSIETLLMMNTSAALSQAMPHHYTSSTLQNPSSSADMLLVNLKDLRLLQFFSKKFRRSLIVSKFLNSLETTAATNGSTKRKGNKYKVNLVPYNIFARGVPKNKLWSGS